METETPYLTQYCNMVYEWRCKGIDIDNATENQAIKIRELREKAIEQSGLTVNELSLICMCRKNGIFKKVNVYANRLKSL